MELASRSKSKGRRRDLWMLLLAYLALALGLASYLAHAGPKVPSWFQLLPFASLLVVGMTIHFWLSVFRRSAAQGLLPTAMLLAGIGLLVAYRIDPQIAYKQAWWIAAGGVVYLATERIAGNLQWMSRYRYTWAVVGIALVALTFVFGTGPSGSKLWLNLGIFYFQPSEAMKLTVPLFLASYLRDNALLLRLGKKVGPIILPSWQYLGPMLALLTLCLAMLAVQGDLGPALLIFGTSIAMIYVATGRKEFVTGSVGIFLMGAGAAYLLVPRVRARFEAWLDPWQDPGGVGFQALQGMYAVANGGVFGVGLGSGYPHLVPAAHTDMVFTVLVEELGIIGGVGVLLAALCYIWGTIIVALRCRDSFARLLTVGLGVATALQTVTIVGGSMRLVPLTGITMPFVSYGGSSLVANFVILAMVHAASERGGS